MSPIATSRRTVRPVAAERRTRLRLRELCDEVLASFRVASGSDVMSADDRREACTLLDRFAPRAGRRERSR